MNIHMKELSVDDFNLYTHEVKDYSGRGVAIYVRNEVVAMSVDNPTYRTVEVIGVKISFRNNDWFMIMGVYKSPSQNNNNLEELKNILLFDKEQDIKFSHRLNVGDFNYGEISWETETTSVNENHSATLFLEIVRDSYLFQHVTNPTRIRESENPSVFDLISTNEQDMVENEIKYLPPLGKSDHTILEFILKLYTDRMDNQQQRLNYYKGNYEKINENLSQINWDKNFEGKSTNESWKTVPGPYIKNSKITNQCVKLIEYGILLG